MFETFKKSITSVIKPPQVFETFKKCITSVIKPPQKVWNI